MRYPCRSICVDLSQSGRSAGERGGRYSGTEPIFLFLLQNQTSGWSAETIINRQRRETVKLEVARIIGKITSYSGSTLPPQSSDRTSDSGIPRQEIFWMGSMVLTKSDGFVLLNRDVCGQIHQPVFLLIVQVFTVVCMLVSSSSYSSRSRKHISIDSRCRKNCVLELTPL